MVRSGAGTGVHRPNGAIEDDAGGNPLLDVTSWRRDRVNINRTADSSWFYADNHQLSYTVEKFFLNDDELAQQSDPDLIVGLECR